MSNEPWNTWPFRAGTSADWECGDMSPHSKARARQRGVTLIELIGVLTVLAIFACALVPVLIRQMDKIAGDQESASLKSISEALQQSILRNRYIPNDANWVSTVATELGVNASNVATNGRKQPRFFLIDPALQVGTNGAGLPYAQTNWVSGSILLSATAVI